MHEGAGVFSKRYATWNMFLQGRPACKVRAGRRLQDGQSVCNLDTGRYTTMHNLVYNWCASCTERRRQNLDGNQDSDL